MPSGGEGSGAAPIFISYRRSDAGGHARLLFDKVSAWFGSERVFYDHDKLDPGDHFPATIDAALVAAQVTLAVIGPDWLATLNERAARGPGQIDVVREELRRALELQRANPERLVIPVLVGGAQMFDPVSGITSEPVRLDLAGLNLRDAATLVDGKSVLWDQSLVHLLQQITLRAKLTPCPCRSDEERLRSASQFVTRALQPPDMAPLLTQWGTAPLQAANLGEPRPMLSAFARSITRSIDDWRALSLTEARRKAVRERCRSLLALLYTLCVDLGKARLFAEHPDCAMAVPVRSGGTLRQVYDAVRGSPAPMVLPEPGATADFRPAGTADLDAPDSGTLADRRAYTHRVLWEQAHQSPLRPYPAGHAPLQDGALTELRDRIGWLREIDEVEFLLTGIVPSQDASVTEIQKIAAELNIAVALRTGQPGDLLRIDEAQLNNLVALCLDRIENIQ